ncbi:FusB/FusC family EF-G-binding protein [Paenibacillus sp. UNC451MF]|uniref:FusB/FusC family EF-G-binding protein n=1 Tax=Paenibacillus sp. UNC451MF TaxID=1449063 RepID=UPI0004909F6B|nr:elongation factor G-binding protein [Paenibacillus sp. UNC451MF]
MIQPFIRNHQYNLIQKQMDLLQLTYRTVSDPKVVESVRDSAEAKIIEVFDQATDAQQEMLAAISTLKTAEDFQAYGRSLEPYLIQFPQVTEKQIKKLFHKNKKLTLPHLSTIPYNRVTYLGWLDISTNKMFIVYDLNGQVIGIEGKFTPLNKKGICFICNKHEEVALFSAVSKSKPVNATPDYYKAVGNYMCIHSDACNKNITDVTSLERFIHSVIK